ncbi:MAG: divalent-cation tolerance protein CutA [Methanomassiliicoccales archaeon]|jgi:periplasmic divalent cation tolerance protein|nr:divalent-cation tolerance protein CutA [Methanomassiliicoccales archaeon]
MYSTVLITTPDRESARNIAQTVLGRRLAACANYFPIKSMYWWKGRIEEAEEFILLLKIRTEDFQELLKLVLDKHPYEIPCVVRYDIVEGHDKYLDWIRESTARPSAD